MSGDGDRRDSVAQGAGVRGVRALASGEAPSNGPYAKTCACGEQGATGA
eukprot:gene4830-22495_t